MQQAIIIHFANAARHCGWTTTDKRTKFTDGRQAPVAVGGKSEVVAVENSLRPFHGPAGRWVLPSQIRGQVSPATEAYAGSLCVAFLALPALPATPLTTIVPAFLPFALRETLADPLFVALPSTLADPAVTSASVVPALLVIADWLARAIEVDTNILGACALSTTPTAPIVTAFLPVAIRLAGARNCSGASETELWRADGGSNGVAVRNAVVVVVTAALGPGASTLHTFEASVRPRWILRW